jgi:hypothetical protein
MGAGACAVLAAPWVGVLSAKYGRLTIGTAGSSTYRQYGADWEPGERRPPIGLRKPPLDAYNVWHDATLDATEPVAVPEGLPPPLRERAVRHLRLVWRNLGVIARHLGSVDELCLTMAALALTPLAFALTRRRRGAAFGYGAAGLAAVVYCGGYAVVFAGVGRYYWFVFLVLTVLAFHFVGVLPGVLGMRLSEERRRLLAAALVVAAVVSFAFHPVRALGVLFSGPPPGREHRVVAERLAGLGIRGPLACVGEDAWWNGLHVAYYLDAQYAGTPRATTPSGIADEMREAEARALLVWGVPRDAAALAASPSLELAGAIPSSGAAPLPRSVAVLRLRAPSHR